MISSNTIHTDRLTLRPLEMNDAKSAFEILGCRKTTNGRSFAKETYGEAQVWLSKRVNEWSIDGFGWWAVETQKQQVIGFCGFFLREHVLELGYVIKAEFQGKGYGSEAVGVALSFARSAELSVYATIRPSNVQSKKVAESCGMILMPTRRKDAPELDLYQTP
jgi:RimJ/RimL family protein N-acetyltransferase